MLECTLEFLRFFYDIFFLLQIKKEKCKKAKIIVFRCNAVSSKIFWKK